MALPEAVAHAQAKVAQVRRRLTILSILGSWPVIVTFCLLAIALFHMIQPRLGLTIAWWQSLLVGFGATVVGCCVLVWRQRPTPDTAAMAMDQAYHLQERTTTLLSLTPEQFASPAGQALASDTKEHLDSIRVSERFPLRQQPRSLAAPLGAVGVLLLALLLPWPQPGNAAQNEQVKTPETTPQVNIDLAELPKKNEERRERVKEIQSEKLEELQENIDKLFRQMEQVKNDSQLQQAVQDTTRMQEALRERQSQMQPSETVRQQMESLAPEENETGPATELKQALAESDFEKAKQELQKLVQKLNSPLSPEERRKAEQQLADLQQKLQDQATQKERQEALDKATMDPEARAKEQAKLNNDKKNLQDLQKLADRLKVMNQALKDAKPSDLQKSLENMQDLLNQMEKQQMELDELAQAQKDMQDLRQCLG